MALEVRYTPYPVYPSVFQWIERPLFALNNKVNELALTEGVRAVVPDDSRLNAAGFHHLRNRRIREAADCFVRGNQHKLAKCVFWAKIYGLTTAASLVSLPIAALTPLTIAADIVVGAAEASSAKWNGATNRQIFRILHKKWIASPVQQLCFAMASIAQKIATLSFGFFCSFAMLFAQLKFAHPWLTTWRITNLVMDNITQKGSMLWMIFCSMIGVGVLEYSTSQRFFGERLPNCFKPEGFSIFINGGARNEFGQQYTNFFAQVDAEFAAEPQNSLTGVAAWNAFRYDLKLEEIVLAKDSQMAPFLADLKIKSREEFLQIDMPIEEQTIKACLRKWALILHPDRNPTETEQAKALFNALKVALQTLRDEANN